MSFLLLIPLLVAPAFAETTVLFPLQGYFRPGKYMPVQISGDGGGTISFRSPGAIETQISPAISPVTLPWLIITTPQPALWADNAADHPIEQPFRAITSNERLIGSTTNATDIALQLFPGTTVIPISLNPADPLPGPTEAWEALDAVILDDARALNDETIATLLSAGVMIAVRGAPPDARWPWERVGDYAILRYSPAGPTSIVSEAAYNPTHAWRPELPAAARRQIFLLGLIFAFVVLGASLWRSRWMLWTVLTIAIAAGAVFIVLRAIQSPLRQAAGAIIVSGPPLTQTDDWTFQTSSRAESMTLPAQHTRPIFASPALVGQYEMKLICDQEGVPQRFEYQIKDNSRIAFLSRRVERAATPAAASLPITSPLQNTAVMLYLTSDARIAGQVESSAGRWPGIVIQRNLNHSLSSVPRVTPN